MSKYENQEALVLSAKRVQSRLARADELGIANLDFEGLKELVNNLSLAKAIQTGKAVELCTRGQEFYVQTLVDATTKSVDELVDAEYKAATLELGSESEIMNMLQDMQNNLS